MNIPPYGNELRKFGAGHGSLLVVANDVPNMTVSVTNGIFWVNGKILKSFGGAVSPVLQKPTRDSHLALITLNSNGFIHIEYGEPSVNPTAPSCPRNCLPLAVIKIHQSTTNITNNMIFDVRTISSMLYSHKDLTDRNDSNAHSISDITGLQDALSARPTDVDIATSVFNKADSDGTHSPSFKINKDATGSPTEDMFLLFERGDAADVGIRWNETTLQLEYSNDGNTWIAFGSTGSGAEYTLPVASDTVLGGIKVGDNLSITTDGILSATGGPASFDWSEIVNKPTEFTPTVHSHSYNDLTDKPVIPAAYTHPATHDASMITETTDKLFMTNSEKAKLASIADNANDYTLPIASDTILGGIKVGSGLSIDGVTGLLSTLPVDVLGASFVPAVSSDWTSVPDTVKQAIDMLAARIKALEP